MIEAATTWSGEIRINGTVTVKKEGALTILPGSRIIFERIDRDGDGIGDAEIYVEGGLLAQGTEQEPILFTSAAANPQPADWKFLYIDYARQAELEHIIVEYAYSGVQIHFCKARVHHSEFRYNVDGLRFSTANVEISANDIHDNTHGIRYEERRGSGTVQGNRIIDNDIGIFAVTRCEGLTRFSDNDIVSRRYNVKLGIEQRAPLPFPHNWWGTSDPAAIRATIYDQHFDPGLGKVTAAEPLTGPIPFKQQPRSKGAFR